MRTRLVSLAIALPIFAFAMSGQLRAEENPVVAKVNGQEILRSEVVEAQKLLPQQYQQIPLESVFPTLLDSLIDTHLSAADARKQGLNESDSFKKEMQRIERQVLQRIVLNMVLDQEVTPQAVQQAYDKMVNSSTGNEEVHARHILVKTEDEAKAVIAELDSGAVFAELAKTKSTGPSGPKGGDLGYFSRGQMVPEFEKVAFALDKGGYTKNPVKTQFGFHVIFQEDKRAKAPAAFDQVQQKLQGELSQAAGSKYLGALRKAAKIEKFASKPEASPLPTIAK